MPLDVSVLKPQVDDTASAEVIDFASAASRGSAAFYAHHAAELHKAAADLGNSARRLDAYAAAMCRSLDDLDVQQRTLEMEASRARRISVQAGKIAQAIDSGDIQALHAVRAEGLERARVR
jgi:hypothetical protein